MLRVAWPSSAISATAVPQSVNSTVTVPIGAVCTGLDARNRPPVVFRTASTARPLSKPPPLVAGSPSELKALSRVNQIFSPCASNAYQLPSSRFSSGFGVNAKPWPLNAEVNQWPLTLASTGVSVASAPSGRAVKPSG